MEKDWIKTYSTNQMHMIHLAQELLQERHIDSIYINKQDSSYPMIGTIELFVNKEDVLLASHLIQKLTTNE